MLEKYNHIRSRMASLRHRKRRASRNPNRAGRHATAEEELGTVDAGARAPPPDAARVWRGRVHAGAHQFALPSSRIAAGMSTARISVASTRIANVRPTPSILMGDTWDVAIAMHTIDMISAAAVTMGPTRCSPYITAVLVSRSARYSSMIRDSKNTS